MAESLRGRLLVWYTLTLLLVIGSFGATVCGLYWRSLIRDIDQDLRGRADMVAAALRPASGGAFDLELTGTAARDFGAPGDHVPYYAIWTSDGKPVASSDPEADRRTPTRPGAHSHEGRREVTIVTADGAVVLVGRDAADARQWPGHGRCTADGREYPGTPLALVPPWRVARPRAESERSPEAKPWLPSRLYWKIPCP